MLTAKSYIKLANVVRESMDEVMNVNDGFATDPAVRETRRQGIIIVAQNMAFMLADDNPRFERSVFMNACGIGEF